jgi:hypothetical protein
MAGIIYRAKNHIYLSGLILSFQPIQIRAF